MEKKHVINSLGCCAAGICESCHYRGVDDCDSEMCKDAIALLKANEPAKPKYSLVNIYTKRTDLSEYLSGKIVARCSDAEYKRMREHYAMEKDVQLVALFRWEGSKCFCKIKCPINPLTVKGEFEVPTTGALDRFLKANGWGFKQKLYPSMFE